MNEVISLDSRDCYYSIWAPVFARQPLSRFNIQLFVGIGALGAMLVWIITVRAGEHLFQPGDLVLYVPLALFGIYHVAGILWRLFIQWRLRGNGQNDVAIIDKVECQKRDTEWAYWRITLTTHRSDMTITLKLMSRVEIVPVKTGQCLELLYLSPMMFMVT